MKISGHPTWLDPTSPPGAYTGKREHTFEQNMGKTFYFFRHAVLIMAFLPLACATRLHTTKNLPRLDADHAIIFGKMEYWENDKLIDKPVGTFFDPDPVIVNHISRYVSDASLNRHTWKPGEYCFKVEVCKDGYFSVVVPPGKYYFVEMMYVYFFDAKPVFEVRTYMGKQPSLLTFDALANQAVYIGTIRHSFHTQANNLFYFKSRLEIESTNDFAEANNWFLKSNQRFQTNVVEGMLKMWHRPNEIHAEPNTNRAVEQTVGETL